MTTAPKRLLYSVAEAAELVNLSTRECWRLIARGEWPVIRSGRRTLVTLQDLEAWIARKRQHSVIYPMRRRA